MKLLKPRFLVLALSLAWMAYFLAGMRYGFYGTDEGDMELLGWRLLRGQTLYRDVYSFHPPLTAWLHAALLALWLPNQGTHLFLVHRALWGLQYLAAILLAVSGLRFWHGGSKSGPTWRFIAPLALIPLFHVGLAPALLYDWDGLFFSSLGFCLLGYWLQSRRPGAALATGAALGAAVLAKQSYIFVALGGALAVLIASPRPKLRSAALCACGTALAGLLAAVAITASGVPLGDWLRAILIDPGLASGFRLVDSFVLSHLPQLGPNSPWMFVTLAGLALTAYAARARTKPGARLACAVSAALLFLIPPALDAPFYDAVNVPLDLFSYAALAAVSIAAAIRGERRTLALAVFCASLQYSATLSLGFGAHFAYSGLFVPLGFLFARAAEPGIIDRRPLLIALAGLSLAGACYSSSLVYGDAPRAAETATFREPLLAGLHSTPERVAAIEGMLARVRTELAGESTHDGRVFFAMQNEFGYLALDALPPTHLTWFDPQEITEASFERAIKELSLHPPRVIVTDAYWEQMLRAPWGALKAERFNDLQHWIEDHYGLAAAFEGWQAPPEIQDAFRIWVPRKALAGAPDAQH